eukprot:TRINITY_DN75828_c0_g1_i2.p1 TRINITY_DN75828_c0_g1~~TRINITY_DN75828_c0_g1_i2.p1  ORF type:complete len:259 (-),score=15.72 TRINITY_DN75828_c0_g1_i2:133-909(-)
MSCQASTTTAGTKCVVKYAYVHGFASGPFAAKGLMLKSSFQKIGITLELPDMNQPSFESMTCTSSLQVLDRLHTTVSTREGHAVKWRLIGSSMGSYLAARWAQLNPTCVDRLILLSPAFNFPKVVAGMSPREHVLAEWEQKGHLTMPGPNGSAQKVHWGLMYDYLRHPPEPDVSCSTLIIQGRHDALVPAAIAIDYSKVRQEHVKLILLDDDHGLIKSMPMICRNISSFFGIDELPSVAPPTRKVAELDHDVLPRGKL